MDTIMELNYIHALINKHLYDFLEQFLQPNTPEVASTFR